MAPVEVFHYIPREALPSSVFPNVISAERMGEFWKQLNLPEFTDEDRLAYEHFFDLPEVCDIPSFYNEVVPFAEAQLRWN